MSHPPPSRITLSSDGSRPSLHIPNRGTITGTTLRSAGTGRAKAYRFAGVPYALPPAGPRRWTKPAALPPSFRYDAQGREYTTFPPKCPQPVHTLVGPPAPPAHTSEDCLYVNIWVPAREPPPALRQRGWPLLFAIHGGWLQVGDAYQAPEKDYGDLLSALEDGGAGLDGVVVCASYRLNAFGFLASRALAPDPDPQHDAGEGTANFGLHDQRAALEWAAAHARYLGADRGNITVSGLSAGSQSAHAQLLHEFSRAQRDAAYQPLPLIRRVLLRSGTAMLPCKTLDEVAPQLRELCDALGIVPRDAGGGDSLSADKARIEALRSVPAQDIVDVLLKLRMHTFRAVQDGGPRNGGFVSETWGDDMRSGRFSKWCKRHGITFILGECAQEEQLYRLWTPPQGPDLHADSLRQIENYYPRAVVRHLLSAYTPPSPSSNEDPRAWADFCGAVTSDAQVYAAERLLVTWLLAHRGQGGDGGGLDDADVLRYRLERRAAVLDATAPREMGVYHGTCEWVYGFLRASMLTAEDAHEAQRDVQVFREWLRPVRAWVAGAPQKSVAEAWYGGESPRGRVRIMRPSGAIEATADPLIEDKAGAVQALDRAIAAAAAAAAPPM